MQRSASTQTRTYRTKYPAVNTNRLRVIRVVLCHPYRLNNTGFATLRHEDNAVRGFWSCLQFEDQDIENAYAEHIALLNNRRIKFGHKWFTAIGMCIFCLVGLAHLLGLSDWKIARLLLARIAVTIVFIAYYLTWGQGGGGGQTLQGSFSAVSIPNFLVNASCESSRRDLSTMYTFLHIPDLKCPNKNCQHVCKFLETSA